MGFVKVAPKDTGRFILQYKLYEAQDVSLEERIAVLEEFKKRDYREKWAYELAYLYHRIGLATKCVEECDELILWFGEGKYVIKAMELKMLHEPLTPEQQIKYDHRFDKNVEDSMTRVLPTVQIQKELQKEALSHTQEILEAPTQRLPLEEIDIQVKMVDVGQYDTINIQKELAESMKEILPPGQEITPETGIIQPERIQSEMASGQEDFSQSEQPETVEALEGVEAWNQASPAFTFYDHKSENLEQDLEAWNQVESAAFTFYDPKTGQLPVEEQAKLAQELAGWNQVESAAFTFYDFKGQAQKTAQEQQQAENISTPQEEITKAIVAPLLQETTDMSEVSSELSTQYPSSGMTEVFFGETGEIQLDEVKEDKTSQIVMEQIKEDVIAAKNAVNKPETKVIPPQALPSQPLDKILSMEYDGQLSMVMPDTEKIEKQITGQLSIEDILSEWERMKKESEMKCMEAVRQRVLQETGDMFAEFDESAKFGLLEQLEGLAQATEPLQDSENTEEPAEAEEMAEETEGTPEVEEVPEEIEETAEVEEVPEEIEETAEVEEVPEEIEETAEVEEVPEEIEETPEAEEVSEEIEESAEAEEEVAESPQEIMEAVEVETGEEVFFQEGEDSEEELGNFFADRKEEETEKEEIVAEVYFNDKSESEEKAEEETKEETAESQQEKPKLRDFTREERELFASFVQDRSSKEQLIQALENISLASFTGNIIITGEEAETTFALAKNLVRNFQLSDSNFSGKIAKISGEGLNKKNIAETVGKLENGALLIQNASGLNEETVKNLAKVLEQENHGIIVVLEDTKKSMNRLLEKNSVLKSSFNARIDIKAMDNDSLVEFAKKYAYEKEYSIDEMGVLALHTRIADMQTLDHAVTVAEVKEIMDEAIERANRKNISHFFDVVLSKRYDEEDMIVLREKDFI